MTSLQSRHWHGSGHLADTSSDALATQRVSVLVTVGTELPFDRLVAAVDSWAVAQGRSDEVFAQIGRSTHPPAHLRWTRFLDGPQFQELFCSVDLIVSHAGMGTILSALQYARPLIVMPRRASLGEHRNEHQLATANRLSEAGRVEMALNEQELVERLQARRLEPREAIGPWAQEALVDAISNAIRPDERVGASGRYARDVSSRSHVS